MGMVTIHKCNRARVLAQWGCPKMPPPSESLGPEVTNLVQLVGTGDLKAGWFQNAFGELE